MYSPVFSSKSKLSRMDEWIQSQTVFGKLSSSLTFCLTFHDLLFVDISSFAVGSGGTGIEN